MKANVTDYIDMKRSSGIIYPHVHRTAMVQINSTRM